MAMDSLTAESRRSQMTRSRVAGRKRNRTRKNKSGERTTVYLLIEFITKLTRCSYHFIQQ